MQTFIYSLSAAHLNLTTFRDIYAHGLKTSHTHFHTHTYPPARVNAILHILSSLLLSFFLFLSPFSSTSLFLSLFLSLPPSLSLFFSMSLSITTHRLKFYSNLRIQTLTHALVATFISPSKHIHIYIMHEFTW